MSRPTIFWGEVTAKSKKEAMIQDERIAYFSMEIGIDPAMPTFSGGLGILAGDTIRSAADLGIPLVAVTLLYRKGYFFQKIDATGWQREESAEWIVEDFLKEMSERTSVVIEGRTVQIRAWRYDVKGQDGEEEFYVPIFFLDTDLEENSPWDRTLTHELYGGDSHYRFCQEVVLGIGGVRMLRKLGYSHIERFHMNEGHASLLTLELLDEEVARSDDTKIEPEDIDAVRQQCVFTTHTPVPAGHDKFPMDLVRRVLGNRDVYEMHNVFCCEGILNMTYLALNLSHYVNGVAKRHQEISQMMFSKYKIDEITNGVHASTWTSSSFQTLFDKYIPGWRQDNFSLRYALSIPGEDIWKAHREAKKELLRRVNHETNIGMDIDVITIGFARRAATYKQADLLFTDLERLKEISQEAGALQIIYAGKAHPQDQGGKDIIKRIVEAAVSLRRLIKIVYLPNYDMELGKLLIPGVDVWLNTPQPPMEASGTSGMKAALNGVPSLSVLDGWWIEGCIEGITGWAIGQKDQDFDRALYAGSLYDKLRDEVLPMYYLSDSEKFINVMRHAIALNGSFFNTQRMLQQYVTNAYYR